MTDSTTPNPHDRFVKLTFGRIPLARSFFAQHLPADVLNEIDLDSLQLTKDSFVDDEFRGSYSDLVFTARQKSRTDNRLADAAICRANL